MLFKWVTDRSHRNVVTYDELVQLFLSLHDPSKFRAQGTKAPGTGLYRCEVHARSEEQAEFANRVASAVASRMVLAEGVATRVVVAPEFTKPVTPAHQAYLHRAKGRPIFLGAPIRPRAGESQDGGQLPRCQQKNNSELARSSELGGLSNPLGL